MVPKVENKQKLNHRCTWALKIACHSAKYSLCHGEQGEDRTSSKVDLIDWALSLESKVDWLDHFSLKMTVG
jgi:hypothetical protein